MVTANPLDKSTRPGSAQSPQGQIVALEQEIEEMELEDEKLSREAKQKVRQKHAHQRLHAPVRMMGASCAPSPYRPEMSKWSCN